MRADEVRELTEAELDEEIANAEQEVFRLRYRKAYQELENPTLIRNRRRDLARMKTIRRERELAAAETEDEERGPGDE